MSDIFVLSNVIDVKGVPDKIAILPMGYVTSQKGNFIVDKESFSMIYTAFKSRNIDIVIDYEHQTLDSSQAPAGGWIKDLAIENNLIVAKVEWTNRAKEYLQNREYRYLSPVIQTRKNDRKVTSIHSVALTNAPAINGMKPIVNSLKGNNDMDENLNQTTPPTASNLADGTSDNQIADLDSFTNHLKVLLSLPEETKLEEIIEKVKEMLQTSSESESKLDSLKYQIHRNEADAVITQAFKDGKITRAMRPMMEKLAYSDLDAFKAYVEASPQIVPMGKLELIDAPLTALKSDAGDYHSSQASRLLRISEEDYKKYQ